jgi:hypothetical protein
MYLGGSVCIWLVRAWKIGEIEEEAAATGKSVGDVDPLTVHNATEEKLSVSFKRSPFVKRMLMWKKV